MRTLRRFNLPSRLRVPRSSRCAQSKVPIAWLPTCACHFRRGEAANTVQGLRAQFARLCVKCKATSRSLMLKFSQPLQSMLRAHATETENESVPECYFCRPVRLSRPQCTASQDAEVAAPPSSTPGTPEPDDAPPPKRWNWLDSADAQRAHAILAAILLTGTLPWAQEQPNAPLIYFVALAVTTIYIGSHKALTTDLRQQISFKEVFLSSSGDGSHRALQCS